MCGFLFLMEVWLVYHTLYFSIKSVACNLVLPLSQNIVWLVILYSLCPKILGILGGCDTLSIMNLNTTNATPMIINIMLLCLSCPFWILYAWLFDPKYYVVFIDVFVRLIITIK